MFVLDKVFENIFSPKGWQKNSQKCKSHNVRILSIVQWFYPFSNANSMRKTSPMHLNTSPTSLEGSGTGKHRTKQKTFRNIRTCPEKTAMWGYSCKMREAHTAGRICTK